MKIFLDTANIDEIKKAMEWGIIDGVTTNPTLISKENAIFEDRVKEICEVVNGPVSAEVISMNYEDMVKEAKELAKINSNIVIKIPMTKEGIKALKILSKNNIKTNVTLVFSPLQALLAAKAGATYVSPFIGRLDDIGHIGMELVDMINEIFLNYDFETEVIVASIRHPEHVLEAGLHGADIVTLPFLALEKMFNHPLTDLGIQRFNKDWEKYLNYKKSKES